MNSLQSDCLHLLAVWVWREWVPKICVSSFHLETAVSGHKLIKLNNPLSCCLSRCYDLRNMFSKWSAVGLYCVLVLNLGPSLRHTKADCVEELSQVKASCQIYQSKALLAVKQIFDEEQQCPPCSEFSNELKDDELKQSKAINTERLDRNFKTVIAGKTWLLAMLLQHNFSIV